MRKIIKKTFIIFALLLLIGCGYLDPNEVDETYVRSILKKELHRLFGNDFVIEMQSFNEESELKEATAVAYPKGEPTLAFEINGSIEDDCIEANSCYGSSYHIKNESIFEKILLAKILNDLATEYDFKINSRTDYKELSKDILSYLDDFNYKLSPYKEGTYFKSYFEKKHIKRGNIPIVINEEFRRIELIVDSNNDKVVIDYTSGEKGWTGEIKIEDYFKNLVARY